MRKVISFCVWGNSPIYNCGLYENALLLPSIFPGWIMTIYYTPTADLKIINTLKTMANVECIEFDVPDHHKNTMLRFIAGFELKNDIVIFRDADSRLLKRDYVFVQDWLKTKKNAHIIRDHPNNKIDILAGLWGVRNKILAKPEIILKFWDYFKNPEYKFWSVDQQYLSKYIYPIIKKTSCIHAQFNKREPWASNIPKNIPSRKHGFCGMTVKSIPNAAKKFNMENDKYEKIRITSKDSISQNTLKKIDEELSKVQKKILQIPDEITSLFSW